MALFGESGGRPTAVAVSRSLHHAALDQRFSELYLVGCVVEEPLAANGVTRFVVWQWRRECRAVVLYGVIVWGLEVSKVRLRCAVRATVLRLFIRSSRSTRDVSRRHPCSRDTSTSHVSFVRRHRLNSSSTRCQVGKHTSHYLRWLPSLLRDHNPGHLN